jgi:hypothetical protein
MNMTSSLHGHDVIKSILTYWLLCINKHTTSSLHDHDVIMMSSYKILTKTSPKSISKYNYSQAVSHWYLAEEFVELNYLSSPKQKQTYVQFLLKSPGQPQWNATFCLRFSVTWLKWLPLTHNVTETIIINSET